MKICMLFLVILLCFSCSNQDKCKAIGKWEINNIVFVSSPNETELDEIFENCIHKEVTITESKFIFSANECFLYQSIDDFKITKHYTLSFKEASLNTNYYDKTLDYLFDFGKRTTIEAYKMNYTFNSSEGEVPELEIFIVDDNHIIINQHHNIVFLDRK